MQRTDEKRRCSILKKRRSRSLSPKSPKEHAARRASRRISFSGKHNVREFFTNENTAIVWGETYDVSTEKHVLSNEQITLQSSRHSSMSATLQTTRNESVAMDMSSAIAPSKVAFDLPSEKETVIQKPLIFRKPTPYHEDQKENIMIQDITDTELSFVLPPPPNKMEPSKSAFSMSLKPSLFNFSKKPQVVDSLPAAERTNGSDNMDISGIELTLPSAQNQEPSGSTEMNARTKESAYTKWLRESNLIAKPNEEKSDHRKTTNQPIDILLDESRRVKSPLKSQNIMPLSRQTINEPAEMSIGPTITSNVAQSKADGSSIDMSIEITTENVKPQSNRRQTVYQALDMEIETCGAASLAAQQDHFNKSTSNKPKNRTTINKTLDLSLDVTTNQSKQNLCGQLTEMSIQNLPMEMQPSMEKPNFRRQTTNQGQDMDLEMSLAPSLQQPSSRNANNRKTIHEPHEISFDKTINQSRVNHLSRLNELSIQYTSMERQSTKKNQHSRRQTMNQAQDMDIETSDLAPSKEQPSSRNANSRKTVHEPHDLSFDKTINQLEENHLGRPNEMSIEYQSMERQPTRRQTTHKAQDMSLDETTESGAHRQGTNHVKDMSLEMMHSPAMQHGNPNWKMSTHSSNRMTINEHRDMSFDSNATCKSSTRNNKTILADMSMDLQSTGHTSQYPRQQRKSVICKSPSKNATKVFDESSLELTKAIEQNVSYHPLHSTKLNDINCSRFTDIDFDASMEETFVEEKKHVDPAPLKRNVQISNAAQSQTVHSICDLDMSDETSPIPTAKKFNLNKTPYYAGLDKENELLETMRLSDSSSIEYTTLHGMEEKPADELNRQSAVFHVTIKDDSEMNASNRTIAEAIEISDASDMSVHVPTSSSENMKRKTCVEEVTMTMDSMQNIQTKRMTIANQSLFQLSSMESPNRIDLPISDVLHHVNETKRATMNNSMNELLFNYANTSNAAEESKQLTFIEDDEDEDQICNTKIDLASSVEGSEINDSVERKCASMRKSHELSRFSMHSDASMASMTIPDKVSPTEVPIPAIELNAFKKSSRLRHSNVFDTNEMANANNSESIVRVDDIPSAGTSLAQISQSSIMQRRCSNSTNNDANESSFLMKRPDKALSEIKLDFSGYEKLAGLATPMDVIRDFLNRMEQIDRQEEEWAEQRRKFAAGEIDSFDIFNNNDDELVSQNVEAPSWTFLYKNKIEWEAEQQRLEIEREFAARPPGAYLPPIPGVDVLLLNKCRNLNNWTFDDTWFFVGNIHLRNIHMHAFIVVLIYDPDTIDDDIESYGVFRIKRIVYQFCKLHMQEIDCPRFLLEVQELKSKLPKNLLPMCETSRHVSNLDDKLNEYCVGAINKTNEVRQMCKKTNALLKEENGTIFIMKTMFDFKGYNYQDFIIELSDIDTTDWRNVKTNPRRALNEEIKSLPSGIPFIKELLFNCSKYVPWQ